MHNRTASTRTDNLTIRWTAAERATLQAAAVVVGQSESSFIRSGALAAARATLKPAAPAEPPEADK